MTGAAWRRVASVLEEALARPDAERRAYVDEACRDDAALRAEVLTLLQAHDRAGDFLQQSVWDAAGDLLDDEVDNAHVEPPMELGHYLVRERLGTGGMGVVFMAEDTRLARRVALKAIAPGRGGLLAYRERLRQEARAAATVVHPHVAAVFALEEIDGQLYLVSEYVPGRTLREIIAQGPLSIEVVLAIAEQLASALVAAHAHSVVHGDLKPDNIVVTPSGTVKVLDFGLAHIQGQVGEPPTGGTPAYMAPEQARGEPADHRSDQFAFGLIIRELLSDEIPPFEASDPGTFESRADCPPELMAIVRRCLGERPEQRYVSTEELWAALHRLRAEHEYDGLPRHGRWPARRWWTVHQGVACGVYVLALMPLWLERVRMPDGLGMPAALVGLALAVIAISIRLNLWFSIRVLPAEAAAQRVRVRVWRRGSDLAFAVLLALAALALGEASPYPATLMVALAAGLVVASLLIEPTTERAAFGGSSDPA